MLYLNQNYTNQENSWNLQEWSYLVNEVSKTFRLTIEERKILENSPVAKIIATIPFEAKCIEPERTAIAHLCLYTAEKKGFQKYCSHQKTDDSNIYKRLNFISTFEGGNKIIINHGMNILALIMLEGYRKSKQKDKKSNTYNPLNSGAWNYQSIKNKLLWEINKIKNPNLDWIFTSSPLDTWQ